VIKIKIKKKLSIKEEFEVLKVVMDKFMLLGTLLVAIGFTLLIVGNSINGAWLILGSGLIIYILFLILLIKEYEIIK